MTTEPDLTKLKKQALPTLYTTLTVIEQNTQNIGEWLRLSYKIDFNVTEQTVLNLQAIQQQNMVVSHYIRGVIAEKVRVTKKYVLEKEPVAQEGGQDGNRGYM